MMKIFALILLLFCTTAFANSEDDKWGVKLRLGAYQAQHAIKTDTLELDDNDTFSQAKFPLMIAFPPRNRSYWFTQLFFDYEMPYESNNMNPRNIDKTDLYNHFLNTTEKTFADNNTNWTITADFKTWSVVTGYQIG